ncbi:MAG: YicC/YloC family endoribonuclease [Cytophagales bacterium]|nr:YicC family protein [Bernardetiaceae bacterium]MDW8211661.1 YicC/YloC family endoribonuclease [Cytophagales bacterium]
MTGYGAVQIDNDRYSLTVEVKSLNSKTLDLSVKMIPALSEKEIEIRNYVAQRLERGKINVVVNYTRKVDTQARIRINRPVVRQYYRDLQETAQWLGSTNSDLFRIALSMPEAWEQTPPMPLEEQEWEAVMKGVEQAVDLCDEFRIREGDAMERMLYDSISIIKDFLDEIYFGDSHRIAYIRQRMRRLVSELIEKNALDENRFEQELLFYAEKLDITEEKVRLKSHLEYFLETMEEAGSVGKKLSFIAQEIGREINTIGAKANDADLQRTVVLMKEELEKIKEQLNNVL